MEESDLCVLIKSCKCFVVFGSEMFPGITDLARILEVAESLIALAVFLVKNIVCAVGVEGNSEVFVLHNLISLEHGLRSCCTDVVEGLKLEGLVTHCRNVLDIKLNRVLLSVKNVCNIVRVLNDLSGLLVCGDYLICDSFAVGIGDLEAVRFPLRRDFNRYLNRLASLERSGVEYDNSGVVTAEAVKPDVTCNVHKCTLIYAV